MPLFVGLLVVTFAIAADLGHEAWSTARAQRQTAEHALREFVRFAATSMSYRAQANMYSGLGALFGAVGAHRGAQPSGSPPTADALEQAARRVRECRCAPSFEPNYYFRLSLVDEELRIAGDSLPAAAERRWLADTVIAHARHVRQRDWDVSLIYGGGQSAPRLIAYGIRATPEAAGRGGYAYGFVSAVGPFGDAVFAPLAHEHMLNPAFAGGAISYDSLVSSSVRAPPPDGRVLYDVNPRHRDVRLTMVPRAGHETYSVGPAVPTPATLVADTVHLGAQFGGLVLRVALTTSTPGGAELVAGGVPGSRLLLLFGLLVLVAGLVAVAVLQLRREHELARLRADFTTGVSHELRTPLAQILLYGETLMLERTRSERERRSAAEVIVREARRLMHLVENALHFARTDRQLLRLSPEAVALAALTREIIVDFAPLAWARQVEVRDCLDDAAFVLIDRSAYRQILLNLLDNAVKYGPPGETIVVALEREGASVRLTVDDEGPGVPASDRERIWTPFVRLDSARRGPVGTGIGLAVVRDLVLRHGGRARVEEGAHRGARFVVTLPATPRPDAMRAAAVEEPGHDDTSGDARAAL
jgi:signal transduction histidine kinase